MKKNKFKPLILIVINELCGSDAVTPKNTGTSGAECIEGVLEKQFVARTGFSFATVTAFKTKSAWITAIENKDIVPLFAARVVTNANTEPTVYTTGDFSYQTSPGAKIITYENYLGFCSYSALVSYENSEYTQVFDYNSDGSFVGVYQEDGSVKGQDIKLTVGIRQNTVLDKPSTTLVTTNYLNFKQIINNAVVIKPIFGQDLKGIFDVQLEQVSATATTIKFKAILECGKRPLNSLESGDILVKSALGVTKTFSFVSADDDNVYILTGTGFVSGDTVEIDGVIVQGDIMYEGDAKLKIVVT